jgi:hypothetical protein
MTTTLAMIFVTTGTTVRLSQSFKEVKATADVIHRLRIYETFNGSKKVLLSLLDQAQSARAFYLSPLLEERAYIDLLTERKDFLSKGILPKK